MTQRSFTLPALLALALAACQQPANDSNIAIDNGTADASNAAIETLPPSESPSAPEPDKSAAGNAATPAAAVIPAQYRGRWGMVPADCTSTRGDAKGLITIADTTIRFYESTATLKEQRPAIATSFSGQFGFAGEGQAWDKVVTLTRTGDTLKRADDEGNFTYKRCA
jgi:hypothetical protein